MTANDAVREAIEVLQELGLKEYEAKCFVGLSRLSTATAKQLSDNTDVPRTRVYNAIRVLEAQGLVEIQHSSPKRFRAVPLEEATRTLRDQYESRVERLTCALEQVDSQEPPDAASGQEVWAMTGPEAIANRTRQLVREATEEVVLVVGDRALWSDDLAGCLREVTDDVDVVVGSRAEAVCEQLRERVPAVRTFSAGLEWLRPAGAETAPSIGHLLLIDRSTTLLSTLSSCREEADAIFGTGPRNGLVVLARGLLSHVPAETQPAISE